MRMLDEGMALLDELADKYIEAGAQVKALQKVRDDRETELIDVMREKKLNHFRHGKIKVSIQHLEARDKIRIDRGKENE